MKATTADLYDAYHQTVQVCELQFRSFGKRKRFFGQCAVVSTYEDHRPVLEALKMEGQGRVLIVDAGGSLRVGVIGDRIAGVAVDNNWSGVVVYGVIRDSATIDDLDVGIKALGTTARRGWEKPKERTEGPVKFGCVEFAQGDWVYADEELDVDQALIQANSISEFR
jgi:regulator of ribonuclease activity A